MPHKLLKHLSSPYGSIACFITALFAKVGLMRVLLDIGPDKFGQILIARNFLHGHGISIDQSAICNLSEKFYAPAIGWPPGYSFLISPFLLIWKDNFMIACYIVDCLTALVFFIYLRKTLLLIKFPIWLTNLFLIFQGFFLNEYILQSTPTDFLGMALLLAVLYYSIKIASSSFFSIKLIFLWVLFIVLASSVRYQNLPVSALLLLIMIAWGIIQKRKIWWQSALSALLITASFYILTITIFTSLLSHLQICNNQIYPGAGFMYYKTTGGGSFHLYASSKGFFPENLLQIYPFVIASFINLKFYAIQLASMFGSFTGWMNVAQWLNFLFLIALLITYCRFVVRKKFIVRSEQEIFWLFGGIMSLSVIGFLMFLSVRNDKNVGPPYFIWTFVTMERLYAFPSLFIGIAAWHWFFLKPSATGFKKLLKWLFIVVLLIEVAHGVYFFSKKISGPVNSFDQIVSSDPEKKFIIDFIRQQREKDSTSKIVVTSFARLPGFVANWYGASALFTPLELNNSRPLSSTPVLLLVAIRQNEIFLLKPLLRKPGIQFIKQSGNNYFYSYHIMMSGDP